MTTTFKPATTMPEWVQYDELGRLVAPRELLIPNPDNPRNADDFVFEKSKAFRDLCHSIDEVGVREPIPVYLEANVPHQNAGHRRVAAVDWVNRKREEAYQALIEQGKVKPSEPRPAELEPIKFVPITLVGPPLSNFDREADMWLAESQRVKWPINKLVPFFAQTYHAAPEKIKRDPEYLARRLGLPISRIHLLTSIVKSEVLTRAATNPAEDPLPTKGREKTLRAINRAAEVTAQYRPDVALKVTGRYRLDEETVEVLRQTFVNKAREIYHVYRRPPGVALERIAPKLRYKNQFDDRTVIAWATRPGMIAEDIMPTTVRGAESDPGPSMEESGSERDARRNGRKSDDGGLLEVVKAYAKRHPNAMGEEQLSALISELTKAGELLDSVLLAARKARRSRVA